MKILLITLILVAVIFTLSSETIWVDNFETETGWQLTGEFEINAPQGLGGEHGNADPTSAFEGNKILGVDLTGLGNQAGDYEASLGDHAYLAVSPPINCSLYENVSLTFKSWLGLEQNLYDKGYIEVSNDGGNSWQILWENSDTIQDNSWSDFTLDISGFANFQPDVRIRFAIGTTDSSWFYCGWNIDMLKLEGEICDVTDVTGTVISQEDDSPIEGAQVLLGYNIVYTDAAGEFIMQSAAGDFQMQIIANGFYRVYLDITVEDDMEPISVEMQTLLPPLNLFGESPVVNYVNLSWNSPIDSPEEVVGYNVYKNGSIFLTQTDTLYSELIEVGGIYNYSVSTLYMSGVSEQTEPVSIEVAVTGSEDVELTPDSYKLINYPNPFNPITNISFELTKIGLVELLVYNIKGQKIRTLVDYEMSVGHHKISWNGTDDNGSSVSSGIYFYKMKSGKYTSTKKMILMK